MFSAESMAEIPALEALTGLPESCSAQVAAGLNASQYQHSFDVVSQLPDALPN
jgi:hypothetical protein